MRCFLERVQFSHFTRYAVMVWSQSANTAALHGKSCWFHFFPDIVLALAHLFGSGWPEAFVLMTMHIAVWAICVTMLPIIVAPKVRVTKVR